MIIRKASLAGIGWNVSVLVDATCDDAKEIAEMLSDMGADNKFVELAKDATTCSPNNMGLTYTVFGERETLVAIGRQDDPAELLNTAAHEFTHAAMHITEALGQDPYSESPCYLAGELMGFAADSILRLV